MKFLLMVSLLLGSLMAHANVGENTDDIRCFEKDGRELDLAYIIKVRHNMEMMNRSLTLLDCTGHHGDDKNCEEKGELRKKERQNESCLVLQRQHPSIDHRSWSLCYERQQTLDESNRLVPVTVTADRQASRIYCERSLLQIL